MQIILDGMTELGRHAGAILVLVCASCGAGLWLAQSIPGDWRKQPWVLFPFAIVSGIVPLAMLSLIFSALGWFWPPIVQAGNIGIAVLAVGGLLTWVIRHRKEIIPTISIPGVITASTAILLLLTVRLAFIADLDLPLYSDGAAHYLIVRDLLNPGTPPQGSHILAELFTRYYHFGFHGLVTWLVCVSGETPAAAMLLSGQWLLVLSPLAVFFLIGVTTNNRQGAFFGALAAAIGWQMPAFASNWSKYPAMAGMAVFPVLLGAAFLWWKAQRFSWRAFFGAGNLLAGVILFHARTSVTLLIVGVVFLIIQAIRKLIPSKPVLFLAGLVGILAGIIFSSNPYLYTLYCGSTCATLEAIILLTPLAILSMPWSSMAVLLFILGTLGVTKLPAPEMLPTQNTTWLDGPFLAISMYLPFSVLGGIGVAGLMKHLERWKWQRTMLAVILVLLGVWNVTKIDAFTPDPGCITFRAEDREMMRWIEENIPEDATIFIPGYMVGQTSTGMDAGIWITVLTGRRTRIESYGTNWDSLDVLKEMCKEGDIYIYTGSSPYGFLKERFYREEWYELVFVERDRGIFHVKACLAVK